MSTLCAAPISHDYIPDKFIEFLRRQRPRSALRQTRFAILARANGAARRVDFGFVICDFAATVTKGSP
jgi:hypothetical protein